MAGEEGKSGFARGLAGGGGAGGPGRWRQGPVRVTRRWQEEDVGQLRIRMVELTGDSPIMIQMGKRRPKEEN